MSRWDGGGRAAFLIPLLLSDVAHSSIDSPSAPLIPDISLSLFRPHPTSSTLKAVIDRQMTPPTFLDFPRKVIESCVANDHAIANDKVWIVSSLCSREVNKNRRQTCCFGVNDIDLMIRERQPTRLPGLDRIDCQSANLKILREILSVLRKCVSQQL